MSTAANADARIRELEVTDEAIVAHLEDGRIISVPLAWSWRLAEATPEERAHFRLIGDGEGVHWPDVDEDLSVEGMLCGTPAPRSSASVDPEKPRKRARVARTNAPPRRRGARG